MPLAKTPRPKHAPKHRQQRERTLAQQAQRTVVRNAALLSTAAIAATGVTVANGVVSGDVATSSLGSSLGAVDGGSSDKADAAQLSAAEIQDRAQTVSRSDSRERTDASKEAALDQESGGAVTGSESLDAADPRDIARALLPEYGFAADQYSCLDSLYVSESNWRIDADNPTSSAYGIPQALTETHDMPPGYFTSAEVQIRWGLEYIADSYGSPCSAWSFKQANNWY